jgi:RecB family exonuclease
MLSASPSELAKFLRCRRQWALTYYFKWGVDPMRAKPVGAALLGTRIHAAMEGYYGYDIDPFASVAIIYDIARSQRPEYAAELTGEQDYATIMIAGFMEWAAENGLDEQHEVVSTEQEIDTYILLTNGSMARIHGKLDQIVRRTLDGALQLRDWKTVGTLSKANRIMLDPQMLIYSTLLDLSNKDERVDGALYTMMLRSKRTARATGPFYDQVHIRYNEVERKNALTRITGIMDDMDRVVRQLNAGVDHRLVAYHNPIPDRCDWDCPFVNMCPLFDDGSRVEDAMRAEFIENADAYAYRKLDLLAQVKAAIGMSSPEGGTHG